MVIATVRIVAKSNNIKTIVEILSSVKGQTKDKAGCIFCLFHQEINNKNSITYEEKWESRKQLYNHIRSDLYRKILAVIDMSEHPPEIEFNTVSDTEGMEVIKACLKGS